MVMFHMQTVLYRVSFAQFGFSMFFLRNLGAPAVVVEVHFWSGLLHITPKHRFYSGAFDMTDGFSQVFFFLS